jgi:hypothetical protein
MGRVETVGTKERHTKEISMTRRGLVGLIAGVLLLTASAMGRVSDMNGPSRLGAKPGIGSGSNVITLGSKPGVGSGSNIVTLPV